MTRKKTSHSDDADQLSSEAELPAIHETAARASSPSDQTMTPVLTEEKTQIVEESLAEELQRLKSELEQARAQSLEYLDGWQRSRAEFANYKKRIEREQVLAT